MGGREPSRKRRKKRRFDLPLMIKQTAETISSQKGNAVVPTVRLWESTSIGNVSNDNGHDTHQATEKESLNQHVEHCALPQAPIPLGEHQQPPLDEQIARDRDHGNTISDRNTSVAISQDRNINKEVDFEELIALGLPYERIETMDIDPGDAAIARRSNDESQNEAQTPSTFSSPFIRWEIILSVFLATGSVHFSREQYDLIRVMIMCMKDEFKLTIVKDTIGRIRIVDEHGKVVRNTLPSSSTIYRVVKPSIQKYLGTRSGDIIYNRMTGQYRKVVLSDKPINRDETKVRIIRVIEHARMDISFPPYYNAAKETDAGNYMKESCDQLKTVNASTPGLKHLECMDDLPLIANREHFYSANFAVHAVRKGENITPWHTLHRAYIGDTVSFKVRSTSQLSNDIHRSYGRRDNSSNLTLLGKVCAIGIATAKADTDGNNHIRSERSGSEEERILQELIGKLQYGASHKVLSTKQTINGRQQLFGAGDTIALIRPTMEIVSKHYIALVNRFDVPNGEYDEHIFRINITTDMNGTLAMQLNQPLDAGGNIIKDIADVEVVETNCDPISCAIARQVRSSFGTLKDGRPYFVYRFILFWDGFSVGSKSMEGIYCVSLNIPTRYRSTSNAVRVLSLVPKHVPSSVVFKELLEDIKIGMTTGFEDYDADGNKVVIFLDMVACIGDTPALNEVIDVKGHNAIACCHVCRFRRVTDDKEIKVGNDLDLYKPKYMGTQVHGGKVFAVRSSAKHGALRAHSLGQDTLKRLGMTYLENFPFTDYQKEFHSISNEVQLTSSFVPVVPTTFDSYQSLLIGPDHLISGLAKDCINAVLELLPDSSYITSFEQFAISSLRCGRLRTQKELVDKKKKALYTMTISEMFALVMVAEYSFHCMVVHKEGHQLCDTDTVVSQKCKASIDLVRSLSQVAARLWFRPRVEEDGIAVVHQYNDKYGTTYLKQSQEMIEMHVQSMQNVASYNDDDAREYQACRGRSKKMQDRKKELEASLKETHTVLKLLDKPNVHRLMDLAHVYLPMIGSANRITELEFERAHQAMKRAVEGSNQHESHVDAVSAATYNDWQGRLAMLLRDDDTGISTNRALLRLLYGRDWISDRDGNITTEDDILLERAIGPNLLVRRLLQLQSGNVMNERIAGDGNAFWTGVISNYKDSSPFSDKLERHGLLPFPYSVSGRNSDVDNLTMQYQLVIRKAKELLVTEYDRGDWKLLDRVYPSNHQSDNPRREKEIQPGDIIQCIAIASDDQCHQRHTIQPYQESMGMVDTHKLYLYVLRLYTYNSENYAIVLPCHKVEDNVINQRRAPNEPTRELATQTRRDESNRIKLPNASPYEVHIGEEDVKMVSLARSCQRVFALHRCGLECRKSDASSNLYCYHDEHPLGSQFYIRNRTEGFPPRSA